MIRKLLLFISLIFANKLGQQFLEFLIKGITLLMGVGSGSGVSNSGEEAIFKLLKINHRNTHNPLIVFDVGANQGQFLSLAHNELKNYINVSYHSFEPSEYTFKILSENTKEFKGVKLNNAGLGILEQTMLLHYDKEGSGLASLSKRDLKHIDELVC